MIDEFEVSKLIEILETNLSRSIQFFLQQYYEDEKGTIEAFQLSVHKPFEIKESEIYQGILKARYSVNYFFACRDFTQDELDLEMNLYATLDLQNRFLTLVGDKFFKEDALDFEPFG